MFCFFVVVFLERGEVQSFCVFSGFFLKFLNWEGGGRVQVFEVLQGL